MIVPEVGDLDAAGREKFLGAIDGLMVTRPPALQRQFRIFLNVLRWAAVLRYGRPLDRLPAAKQINVMRWFQNAPLLLLRRGFWGLKTLVFVGYYGGTGVEEKIGFTPSRHGNEMLHG
ncbi:MAG: hypothetical protein ACTSXZ_07465 [Alphaproteobacteria bacterium]